MQWYALVFFLFLKSHAGSQTPDENNLETRVQGKSLGSGIRGEIYPGKVEVRNPASRQLPLDCLSKTAALDLQPLMWGFQNQESLVGFPQRKSISWACMKGPPFSETSTYPLGPRLYHGLRLPLGPS